MRGANAQNGTIHRKMRNTPTRRRNGDMSADSVSSLVDDPSRMIGSQLLFGGPWTHAVSRLGPRSAMSIRGSPDHQLACGPYERTSMTTLCAVGSEAKVSNALP